MRLFIFAIYGLLSWAQTPTLIADLTPTIGPSNPEVSNFLGSFNGFLYFDGILNRNHALFKTDGTDANTVAVAALQTSEALVLNGEMILATYDGLWKTDGTPQGTSLIFTSPGFLEPRYLTLLGSQVFFEASTPLAGRELWITDGTTIGTRMVKDIEPGVGGSCTELTVFQGKLYFMALNLNYGLEPWVSDGTEAGTVLLKDIASGSFSSFPNHFLAHGSELYFSAGTSSHGEELWKTNGTNSGTVMVDDIYPGATGSSPSDLTSFSGRLYFTGSDSLIGTELCVSDGTTAGTVLLKDVNPGPNSSYPVFFRELNGKVFFLSTTSSGQEIWVTDGSPSGTQLFVDHNPGSVSGISRLGPVQGTRLYFSSLPNQDALWSTDGTQAGTVPTTLRTDSLPSDASKFVTSGSKVFFNMNDPGQSTTTLGVSDGTSIGSKVLNMPSLKNPFAFTPTANGIFFLAGQSGFSFGYELWKSDGTLAGTTLIKSHAPVIGQTIHQLTVLNNNAYYVAADETNPTETNLWKSDGTLAGTISLETNLEVQFLTPFQGNLVFYVDQPGSIFTSDGVTVNGSVANLFVHVNSAFVEFGGKLFYQGDIVNGTDMELWAYDGTMSFRVKDLIPGTQSSFPSDLTPVGSRLFFLAHNATGKLHLWATEAVSMNTISLLEVDPTFVRLLGGFDNNLLFLLYTEAYGYELWVSDGSPSGTKMVQDLFAGPISGVRNARVIGNLTYLDVWQPDTGNELWVSDGTPVGTHLVNDLFPGPSGNFFEEFAKLDSTLIFSAASSGNNREIWKLPILPNAAIQTVPFVCSDETGVTAYVLSAGGSATYSWSATNATLTSPSNTPQITFTAGSSGQVELNVEVSNLGQVVQNSLLVPIKTELTSLGPISGSLNPCSSRSETYTVTPDPNVESYTWQIPPTATLFGGQGTNSIDIIPGTGAGEISVIGHNVCSNTAPSSLTMTPVNGFPSAPGSISGASSVCAFSTNVNYSTPTISGASSYSWSVPAGASISSGQGTPGIVVSFGSQSGTVSVLAQNTCGDSVPFSISVSVDPLPSTAMAGPDQNLAAGQVAQLDANTPVVGSGLWSIVSGPSMQSTQFSLTTSPTAVFRPDTSGTYVLRWIIASGACSSSDDVQLVFLSAQLVDLEVEANCSLHYPSVGQSSEVIFTIANHGSTTATGIVVQIGLPNEATVSTMSPSMGVYDALSSTWQIASLTTGSTALLTLSGYPQTLGNKPLQAELIQCNEPDVDSTPNNGLSIEDDQDSCTWEPRAYVNIPDSAFKQVLISDASVDSYDDDEISHFEAEQTLWLDCSNQSIHDLTGLEAFLFLEALDASSNPIAVLPSMQGLSYFRTLILDDGKVGHFYDANSLFALPQDLVTLSVNRNLLNNIPMELFTLSSLEQIYLSQNPIGMPPDFFDMLPNLKYIDLGGCGIRQIPPTLGDHFGLEFLGVRNNGIETLPVGMPFTLTAVDLSFNLLSDVTPLTSCPLLGTVLLSGNALQDISPLLLISDLLTQGHHFVLLDRNNLDGSNCNDLTSLSARANVSGAFLEFNPQGNFSFFYHELPQWVFVPNMLIKWVGDVTQETYLNDLSCP